MQVNTNTPLNQAIQSIGSPFGNEHKNKTSQEVQQVSGEVAQVANTFFPGSGMIIGAIGGVISAITNLS